MTLHVTTRVDLAKGLGVYETLMGTGFGFDGTGAVVSGTISILRGPSGTYLDGVSIVGHCAGCAGFPGTSPTPRGNADDYHLMLQIFAGDDLIDGSFFGDSIVAGSGKDHVLGNDGDDRLLGGSGGDLMESGFGNDTVYGGQGHDILINQWGTDQLYGGKGNDFLQAGQLDDTLTGGAGGGPVCLRFRAGPHHCHGFFRWRGQAGGVGRLGWVPGADRHAGGGRYARFRWASTG